MNGRAARLAASQPLSEEAVKDTDAPGQRERVMRTALRQCRAFVRQPEVSFVLLQRTRALLERMQWVCLDRFRVEPCASAERRRLANLLLEITHELNALEARRR
jgi:hypothetical protein